MPRIIVMADRTTDDGARAVMFAERVNASDFESSHFQNQLVERLEWAVGDAHRAERVPPERRADPRRADRRRTEPSLSQPRPAKAVTAAL